jgi:hypothetical protein
MTPALGWLMTVVALVAVSALVICLLRLKRLLVKPGFEPNMRNTVDVVVKECDEQSFSVEIDPSEVGLRRGGPLRWNFSGPTDATLTIKPVDQDSWPFPSLPSPAKAAPQVPVMAGNVKGNAPTGRRHKYWVVIECNGRTFNIDPDIYILD